MARTRRPQGPREHEARERYPEGDRNRDDEREESGDNPERHARIIERRWLGSPPPTAERYAQALCQWLALPGAVMRPASNVTPAEAAPPTPPNEGTEP
jgi:hypothetical protein